MAADIMETFRTSAATHTNKIGEDLDGLTARIAREVVGTLKDNGLDVALDMRPGGHGCPRSVMKDNYSIVVNGTIMFDGLPVIVTAGYVPTKEPGRSDKHMRLHLGAGCVADIKLECDYSKDKDRWRAMYNSGDIKTEFAAALGRVRASNTFINEADLAPSAARIEVTSPLKLKKPAATA
ncbi:MAG: hypothetical protein ACAH80_05665 [Alphaproteobacteria bacterium]